MSENVPFLLPVLLDLSNKNLLFVGAGKGTALKLQAILQHSSPPYPHLTVIAPIINAEVRHLLLSWPGAEVKERSFVPQDLEGTDLVWGLTDDPDCNALIAREAAARHIFASVSGNRGAGGFIQPAVISGNETPDNLIITVSTKGKNPTLAVLWRDRIKEFLCSYP